MIPRSQIKRTSDQLFKSLAAFDTLGYMATTRISDLETKFSIKLTPAAKLVLVAIIFERIEASVETRDKVVEERIEYSPEYIQELEVSFSEIERSLYIIMEGAYLEPSSFDDAINELFPPRKRTRSRRSSTSIVRQFWKNFCNIPPFCSPTVEEQKEKTDDRSDEQRDEPRGEGDEE